MKKLNKVIGYAVPILCGISFFLIMRFVLMVGYVPTSSMAPTIPPNTFIFGYRIYKELNCGDIIIFKHNNSLLVKRIVAVPGETIYIDENNDLVKDEKYAKRILIVPQNCYFLVGDNINNSYDSRYWDDPFVEKSQIIAKLWLK